MNFKAMFWGFALLILAQSVHAQQSIITINEFKKKVNYNFSSEWQYLSTDLYLMNANRFDDLLNDIPSGKKKKKNNNEFIEYLLMTASIKGLKLGGGDLIYPIYNFQVKQNQENKNLTQINNSLEVIRIIDNLPLASTNDYIDAEINIDAITNKNSNKIYSIVASQLKNISAFTNPTTAIMSLVGEFGKFLESKNQGKEYSFKSTIRIYEEHDFNKRLFSVNFYVFVPSTIEKSGIDTLKIASLLDSLSNPIIDRRMLADLIAFRKYPFLVLANYKSRYVSEPIIGDEITFETTEKRKTKIQQAFEKNLINKDIYIQEMKLIEFLDVFAQLKLKISNYELNSKNKITDNFSKSYFLIMQDYKKLKNTFRSRLDEFSKNAPFQNDFRSRYEAILVNAELYLDQDNNLQSIKDVVNTLYNFEREPNMVLDSAKREIYLKKLYSIELPESEKSSDENKSIQKLIIHLENNQFSELYSARITKLKSTSAGETGNALANDLQLRIKTTWCKTCKSMVNSAIEEYQARYEEFSRKKMISQYENLIKQTKDKLFFVLEKETCVDFHLKNDYSGGLPPHIQLIQSDFFDLVKTRQQLQEIINKELPSENAKIAEYIENITQINTKLEEGYRSICKKVESLCLCK